MATTEARAKLREAHFHSLAMLTLTHGFGFVKGLRLVRRTRWAKTVFRELIRRHCTTQIQFGRVLLRFAQDKIARSKVGVNFYDRRARV